MSFPLDTGTLAIAELQYAYGSGAAAKTAQRWSRCPASTRSAPGTTAQVQRPANRHHRPASRQSLEQRDPGRASRRLLALWGHGPDDLAFEGQSNRSLNVFFRPMFTPFQDRNLVSASINAGFALKAPLPTRDNDVFGMEMGTVWATSGASNFDRQMQVFQPSVYTPIRGSETFIEASYQFQALPSWVDSAGRSVFHQSGHGNRQSETNPRSGSRTSS